MGAWYLLTVIFGKLRFQSFEDWENWFKNYDLAQPMAIIHFTKFRY